LVGAGVKNFILVDGAVVKHSNLERQFIYSHDMIGARKTVAAARYVRDRCADARVDEFDSNIASQSDVQELCTRASGAHICVICIDNSFELAMRILPNALWETGVPCVQSGVMIRSGFLGPVFDRARSPQSPEVYWSQFANIRTSAPLQVCFPPNNSIIASLMVEQVLHHLVGAHRLVEYRDRTFVDLLRRQFTPVTGDWAD
jgi:hypothetical protein